MKPLHNLTDSNTPSSHRRSTSKKSRGELLFVDFFYAFDSIHRGKIGGTSSLLEIVQDW